ncbi:MAG: aldehyde dehydrogenase family protein [Pirellulaceae bacterium]
MSLNKPIFVANRPVFTDNHLDVFDKYSGEQFARVSLAGAAEIEAAIAGAVDATEPMRNLPPYARQEILNHCVKAFENRADELADTLCVEAGKPIKDSRGEVSRLIDTFRIAAEESVRINGEVLNLEIAERTRGYRGMTRRVGIGPCSFISPFNFPLNLVAHKVAPAIAAGCPFILKPASLTPLGALIIGEVLAETDLPPGAFSILPCARDQAAAFTEDERLKLLSFTGSPDVGWKLKSQAGKKKVVLELGGNAACIVDKDADLELAVSRSIVGAFYQSGQSCISVQRIIVHESVVDAFRTKLVEATRKLKQGAPRDESTFIGPIISVGEAKRIKSWIDEAVAAGGQLLCGGELNGSFVSATLLENVPKDQKLVAEEVFGPVALLSTFSNFGDALAEVNDSRFGLQAGVFTNNLAHALQAWDTLEVGGVIIGDVPSWRVDNMPYGGVKDSGLGREGIRNAIVDMTEERLLVIRRG